MLSDLRLKTPLRKARLQYQRERRTGIGIHVGVDVIGRWVIFRAAADVDRTLALIDPHVVNKHLSGEHQG